MAFHLRWWTPARFAIGHGILGAFGARNSSFTKYRLASQAASTSGDLLECERNCKNAVSDRKSVKLPAFYQKFLKKRSYMVKELRQEFAGKLTVKTKYDTGDGDFSDTAAFNAEMEREVLFGIYPVTQALKSSRRRMYQLLLKINPGDETVSSQSIKEIIGLAKQKQVKLKVCSMEMLDKLAGNNPHQGVCLYVSPLLTVPINPTASDEFYDFNQQTLWLYLDQVRDPMNLGAILRTAYYLGVGKVCIPSNGSCKLTPVVSKASAGVMEIMPVYVVENEAEFFTDCRHRGVKVLGTAAAVDFECGDSRPLVPLTSAKIDGPSILILGNEHSGISESLKPFCDTWLTIPSFARASTEQAVEPLSLSLNVSVANGILLYSLLHNTKSRNMGTQC